jgi:tetraacyldisaccharide 4'-kinase
MHPFEFLYYLGFSAVKYFSLTHRERLPYRVVSIGNITTGGTGKTPAAIALAEEAKRRGFSPVILTRGYRGKAKGPCFVTKGEGPLLSVEDAGDEPLLMAERLDGVPIIKGGDRYASGLYALEHIDHGSKGELLFILDDGFQHWHLRRDKDIVLVDASNPFGNRALLPFGRLREPLRSLDRADIIVLSKSNDAGDSQKSASADALVKEIRGYNTNAPIFRAGHRPLSCRLLSGKRNPPEWLFGKKVFGLCALGNPLSFRKTVLSLGAQLIGCSMFRDHHRYRSSDIDKALKAVIKCGAEWIVTTEKDIIKLRNFDLPDHIIIIEVEFAVEEGFYAEAFNFQRVQVSPQGSKR